MPSSSKYFIFLNETEEGVLALEEPLEEVASLEMQGSGGCVEALPEVEG